MQYTSTDYKLSSKWVNYLLDFGVASHVNTVASVWDTHVTCRVIRRALSLTMIIGMGATSPLANSVRG